MSRASPESRDLHILTRINIVAHVYYLYIVININVVTGISVQIV